MRKILSSVAIAIGLFATPAMAEIPTKEAVQVLAESVVPMKRGSSTFCTAFKVGPKQFLTAAHCAQGITDNTKIVSHGKSQSVETVLFPVTKKEDGRRKDWSLFTTTTENSNISSLDLGCKEDVYVGQTVASMGYPSTVGRGQINKAFVKGYVSSVDSPSNIVNQDYVVDMPAAPGASGSPVISLDTGAVVGILIEITTGSRSGSILTGIQNLPDFVCSRD